MVLLILLLSTTTLSAMNTHDHLGSEAQDCINKLSQASDDLSKVCDDIFHINTKENQKTNVLNIFKAYIDNAHIIIANIQNSHPYDLQGHLRDADFFLANLGMQQLSLDTMVKQLKNESFKDNDIEFITKQLSSMNMEK